MISRLCHVDVEATKMILLLGNIEVIMLQWVFVFWLSDSEDGGNWGRGHQGNYLRFLRAQLSSWKLVDCNQPFPCTQFNIANISLLIIQIHNTTSQLLELPCMYLRQGNMHPYPTSLLPFWFVAYFLFMWTTYYVVENSLEWSNLGRG